jgi:hypothetical protein
VGPSPILQELNALGVLRMSSDGTAIMRPDGTVMAQVVANPTISPNGAESATAVQVTLATATAGAKIYYTVDGSTPSASSTEYTAPFNVSSTATLKVIAIAGGQVSSAVISAAFVINGAVATPTFSPVAGAVALNAPVTISSATAGASLYYTVDGSTPTVASTPYTVPVLVTGAMTIKALGVKALFTNSAVGSSAYTIAP